MIIQFKNVSFLLFVLLLSAIQSLAQPKFIFEKFAGTYISAHEFGGSSIEIAANGTFSTVGGSDDGTRISQSGNCNYTDGFIQCVITKMTGKRSDGKEFNLLDPADRKEMFQSVNAGTAEETLKLLLVEWSGRLYLIHENDLINFANAVNLGIEPRMSLISERGISPWYGTFYLRSGDELKKVKGNPDLPQKWLSFLLRKPITAKVISVQKIDESNQFLTTSTVVINKGSADGLKIGMRLVNKNEEPSPWDGPEIIAVRQRTAVIEARLASGKLKVGDKLTTNYTPEHY